MPTSGLKHMNWNELQAATIEQTIAWAQPQPWCQAMAACQQDSVWHAEGDVWTHTQLVLRELVELDEWHNLSALDQCILKFTALFHDSAKPLTTEIDEQGHVRSPKHSMKGEHLTRNVLRDVGADLLTREAIARQVRYHGRPTFLAEREQPEHEIVRMSWLANNRWLYLFALADRRGRQAAESNRTEEDLAYWKLLAEELDCYVASYPFATEHARYTFFRESKPNLHYVPHENFTCEVILMSGLPGSGKDTWIRLNCPEWPVVSLDQLRGELEIEPTENQGQVAQLAKERCREYLRAGQSFIFNATNLLRTTRGRWLELFHAYNARIRIVYKEPPLRTILQQNRDREAAVPESVILKLAQRCEVPTWDECHELNLLP